MIIAANHKSNLDPIFVASAVNKKRKMTAIAKEELFKNKILAKILNKVEIIPINRQNPGLGTIKRILKYIKNDYALVMFPEGTRSKTDDHVQYTLAINYSNLLKYTLVNLYHLKNTINKN